MKTVFNTAVMIFIGMAICCNAGTGDNAAAAKTTSPAKSTAAATAVSSADKAVKKETVAPVAAKKKQDTLVLTARLIEIPGKFAANDLYNYVYIMKYRVMKVEQGAYAGQEILVGHYNPLIPRKQITDKMARFAAGSLVKFNTGDIHRLVLITPVERVWKDAVEDEYFDSDLEKYYALKVDLVK